MSTEALNDELNTYEEDMEEISQILLDNRFSPEEKLDEIAAIIFPDHEEA
jgi:hypothetical protein